MQLYDKHDDRIESKGKIFCPTPSLNCVKGIQDGNLLHP